MYLADKQGRILASPTRNGDTIRFSTRKLPGGPACMFLVDKKGKRVGDQTGYLLTLPGKWSESRRQLGLSEQRLAAVDSELASARTARTESEKRLVASRAYVNGACVAPQMRAIPPKPYSRCASGDECLRDAIQMCAAAAFGAEGCGKMLSEINISGLVSGPACGYAAAMMAEQKYDIADVFTLAGIGAADDLGDALMRKESNALAQLLGGVIRAATTKIKYDGFVSCTKSLYDRHYSPIRRWESDANGIRQEPALAVSRCSSALAEISSLGGKINDLAKSRSAAEQAVSFQRAALREIEARTISRSPACR